MPDGQHEVTLHFAELEAAPAAEQLTGAGWRASHHSGYYRAGQPHLVGTSE